MAHLFISRFKVCRRREIYAVIGAAVILILVIGAIYFLNRSNDTKPHAGAIVANGLECAAIARFVISLG